MTREELDNFLPQLSLKPTESASNAIKQCVSMFSQQTNDDLTNLLQSAVKCCATQSTSINQRESELIGLPTDTLCQLGFFLNRKESIMFGLVCRQSYTITQSTPFLSKRNCNEELRITNKFLQTILSNNYDLFPVAHGVFSCVTLRGRVLSSNLQTLVDICEKNDCYSKWFINLFQSVQSLDISFGMLEECIVPLDPLLEALFGNNNHASLNSLTLRGSPHVPSVDAFFSKLLKFQQEHGKDARIKKVALLLPDVESIPIAKLNFLKLNESLELSLRGGRLKFDDMNEFNILMHENLKRLKLSNIAIDDVTPCDNIKKAAESRYSRYGSGHGDEHDMQLLSRSIETLCISSFEQTDNRNFLVDALNHEQSIQLWNLKHSLKNLYISITWYRMSTDGEISQLEEDIQNLLHVDDGFPNLKLLHIEVENCWTGPMLASKEPKDASRLICKRVENMKSHLLSFVNKWSRDKEVKSSVEKLSDFKLRLNFSVALPTLSDVKRRPSGKPYEVSVVSTHVTQTFDLKNQSVEPQSMIDAGIEELTANIDRAVMNGERNEDFVPFAEDWDSP